MGGSERGENMVSSTVTGASASPLTRKRQRGRPPELGATCLLLGVLLEDTPILGHEMENLSREESLQKIAWGKDAQGEVCPL
jgi:hypothetical protein